jgi:hypothetical protein
MRLHTAVVKHLTDATASSIQILPTKILLNTVTMDSSDRKNVVPAQPLNH